MQMTKTRALRLALLLLGLGVVAVTAEFLLFVKPIGPLGLTRFDTLLAKDIKQERLVASAASAAVAYLNESRSRLAGCPTDAVFTIDMSLVRLLRKRDLRSSLSYNHWDIYLPYRGSGPSGSCIVAVHVAVPEQGGTSRPIDAWVSSSVGSRFEWIPSFGGAAESHDP